MLQYMCAGQHLGRVFFYQVLAIFTNTYEIIDRHNRFRGAVRKASAYGLTSQFKFDLGQKVLKTPLAIESVFMKYSLCSSEIFTFASDRPL